MILDQLSVFFDTVDAAASAVSNVVTVSPFAGRDEPVNVTVLLTGANAAAVSLAVTLQESDDKTAFTDVAPFYLKKPDAAGAVLVFALPYQTRKKFTRLSYALTGSPAGLKVFAGLTRDHFAPYAEGMYLDGRQG
ncbi:MAG: hypothetical protein LBV70_04205 [Candidatus Adiutrix sp.]|jgi:hypothetical protein|nr:hypothetical protein [Candidatus Adiutrix sp.]